MRKGIRDDAISASIIRADAQSRGIRGDCIKRVIMMLADYLSEPIERQKKIENALKMLNQVDRNILVYRYCDNRKWEHIGLLVHYSPEHCYRLCKRALRRFRYYMGRQ